MSDRLTRVVEIVAKVLELDPADVEVSVPFAESTKFKFDSIIGLDILTELERSYKIKIGEKHLSKMTSVERIAAVLDSLAS